MDSHSQDSASPTNAKSIRSAGRSSASTGQTPKRDTGGGTSDARFIARFCPVAEFGLVGATMHQVDECVPVAELEALASTYCAVLDAFFA